MVKARRTVIVLIMVLVFWGVAASETKSKGRRQDVGSQSHYTLAIIPFYSPDKIWLLYSPFIDYLNKTTGLRWELKLYPNHQTLLDDLCGNKISVALLGPVPMGRVYRKCGAEPFLTALGKNGKPSYHSVIVTGDPSVGTLNGLRGRKFGFFKGSTAAHVLPASMLKQSGLEMENIQPVFFESQDRIMSALLAGEVAAAGVKESLFRRFDKAGLRTLQTSAPVPNFAFCSGPSTPARVRERFASALTGLKPLTDPQASEAVKNWDDEIKNGFIRSDKAFLASVLQLQDITSEILHDSE